MPKHKEPAPGWRDDISGFLGSLKAGARSKGTIATRRCQLTALSLALGGSPRDVEGDDLVDWFASHEWKPETRKGARNAVVGFYRWMKLTGRMDDDPSLELPGVKRPQAHPRPCPDVVILKALRGPPMANASCSGSALNAGCAGSRSRRCRAVT